MVRSVGSIFAAGVLILIIAEPLNSCSFQDPVVFELDKRPDPPIEKYLAGELGLIRPSFARSHLVVAYRYLSGRPLNTVEQKGVAELMNQRLSEPNSEPEQKEDAISSWLQARLQAVPDAASHVRVANYGPVPNLRFSFLNCADDAFANATSTLRSRVTEFGAGSAEVRDWLSAQDAVFASCDGGSDPPAPAAVTLPLILRKDRDYQIASAAFYRGDFDEAHAQFVRIAEDRQSPWASLSRYVAARALVRDATLNVREEDAASRQFAHKSEPMHQAQQEVRAILANPKLATLHPAARRLLNFIDIRISPAEYLKRVAGLIASGASPSTIRDDLADYTMILDRDFDSDDEMTDWISTFQEERQHNAFVHAVERWKENRSALWLMAAIGNADAKDEETPALLDAAKAIAPASPAYVTARYQRIRLLHTLNRDAEWVADVDELLSNRDKMGPSTRNALLALRLPVSASLDEFIRDAPREAAGLESQTPLSEPQYYLDDDSVGALNQKLTLDDLVTMSNRSMPAGIDRTLLVTGWTRALLLGRTDVVEKLGPRLAKADPEIAEALNQYLVAKAGDRRSEGVWLLIRFPGLTPYVGNANSRVGSLVDELEDVPHDQFTHENWWCRDSRTLGITPKFATVKGQEEWRALHDKGSGATYVLKRAVQWAKQRPSDPRVPEALSVAIKTTQWACPDPQTRAAARAAYELLHSKYRDTKWAKDTPYWYEGKE